MVGASKDNDKRTDRQGDENRCCDGARTPLPRPPLRKPGRGTMAVHLAKHDSLRRQQPIPLLRAGANIRPTCAACFETAACTCERLSKFRLCMVHATKVPDEALFPFILLIRRKCIRICHDSYP